MHAQCEHTTSNLAESHQNDSVFIYKSTIYMANQEWSSLCRHMISLVITAMTSGWTRHSSTSLVEMCISVLPPGLPVGWSADWPDLWPSLFSLLSLSWSLVVIWHCGESVQLKQHVSFVLLHCGFSVKWTGMRWGPKGTKKGELAELFNTPLESRFTASALGWSSVSSLFLFMQAFTARFKYCMFSSWEETPSYDTQQWRWHDVVEQFPISLMY